MLEVKNLSVEFEMKEKTIKAVSSVGFSLNKGETLGLIGESGSGKSTIALAMLNLLSPPGKIVSGEVLIDGENMLKNSEKYRGSKISMVFQDPFSSLDPVFSIGDQITETISAHRDVSKREARDLAKEILSLVKIDQKRINDYPHQFSGGMRQRVLIAIALSCRPEFLLADEPTTALDITIEEEILSLLKDLQQKLGYGMVFITHNFRVAKKMCDNFVVLKKGETVETGKNVFAEPREEYTKNLVACMRKLYA